jgi:hypothetical protein
LRRDDDEEQQQQQHNLLLETNENSTPIILLHNENNQIDIIENGNQTNENELQDTTNLSLINTDKHEDNIERLSTIYESPSPQPEIDENTYDKLIVYDIAQVDIPTKVNKIYR